VVVAVALGSIITDILRNCIKNVWFYSSERWLMSHSFTYFGYADIICSSIRNIFLFIIWVSNQNLHSISQCCDYYNALMGSRPAANPRYLKSRQLASFF
jgi:hypothetical protein